MADARSDDLLTIFDRARFGPRHGIIFALLSIGLALDFFDFFVVGVLVAVVAPQWHLTYGESAVMLLGGGVGAIIGSLLWGALSDLWGRKILLIWGALICAVSAFSLSLIPDDAWMLFAILRFFVGFGLGAAATSSNPLLVEMLPTRIRTIVASLFIIFATVGTLLASLSGATLLTLLGWRGVAALGIAPGILALLVAVFVPESPRWLVAKGRFVQARETVAWVLGMRAVDLPLQTTLPAIPPRARLGELYVRPGLFWMTAITWCGAATGVYGVILWGPTVFSMLLKIPVAKAAEYFVYVSICGIVGKLVFSFLPYWIGRKRAGILHGTGMAVMLTLAGYYHSIYIAGFPLFVVLVIASDFFLDGGFANLAPYPVEAYGVRLGARASGLAQAANGVGKLVGPIALALIAGTTNFVSPHATEQAIFPAFLFLAGWGIAIALSFALLGYETNGRPIMIEGDREELRSANAPRYAS